MKRTCLAILVLCLVAMGCSSGQTGPDDAGACELSCGDNLACPVGRYCCQAGDPGCALVGCCLVGCTQDHHCTPPLACDRAQRVCVPEEGENPPDETADGAGDGGDFGDEGSGDEVVATDGADVGQDVGDSLADGDGEALEEGPDASEATSEEVADALGDTDPGWLIQAGTGIGPVAVGATLGAARILLGEAGVATDGSYTLSFRADGLWITGIEANGDALYNDGDLIITSTARSGLAAATAEGVRVGDDRASVLAAGYANPDRTALLPAFGQFQGGKMDFYFGRGIWVGYDLQDKVSGITVTKAYPRVPDGTIQAGEGRLAFAGEPVIQCGNGFATDEATGGSKQSKHRGILGAPDFSYAYEESISLGGKDYKVRFWRDAYRVLGLEFIGAKEFELFPGSWTALDHVLAATFYLPYYGMSSGGHRLADSRQAWELELGQPEKYVLSDPQDPNSTRTYIYLLASGRRLALTYTNNGLDPANDVAIFLALNYLEQS